MSTAQHGAVLAPRSTTKSRRVAVPGERNMACSYPVPLARGDCCAPHTNLLRYRCPVFPQGPMSPFLFLKLQGTSPCASLYISPAPASACSHRTAPGTDRLLSLCQSCSLASCISHPSQTCTGVICLFACWPALLLLLLLLLLVVVA